MTEDEMIGMRFGMLTIVSKTDPYIAPTGGVHKRFLCKCDCGAMTVGTKEAIETGKKKSCGCLKKSNGNPTHGEIHTRLYTIWGNMCNRCSNKNNPAYDRYGGRGIFVCDEWKSYEGFRDWARSSGYTDDLTIDRINNNKGYSPDNCRWADIYTQANNKSVNHFVEYNGEKKTIAQWAVDLHIPYKVLFARVVSHQWSVERAFTQPLRRSPKKRSVPNT